MPSFADNPALKSQLETQITFLTEITHRTYDLLRKLSEMNLNVAHQLFEDGIGAGRDMLACTDPFQLAATAMHQLQPATERLRNYQHQLAGVLTGAQLDLTHSAEAQRAAIYSLAGAPAQPA